LSDHLIRVSLLHIEFEGQLRPLLLGQQVIGLGVVSHLNQFQVIYLLEKRVRSLFFKQGLDIFEHGLGEGPLQNDFVGTFEGIVQVGVDLRELVLDHVGFKVDKFVFYISRGEKGPKAVL
jgi:hypothetical protein